MSYEWMDNEYAWEKHHRAVTDDDFRPPEYRGLRAEDYEFDIKGNLLPKERWRSGMLKIAHILGFEGHNFDIEEVVQCVWELSSKEEA